MSLYNTYTTFNIPACIQVGQFSEGIYFAETVLSGSEVVMGEVMLGR